MATTKPKASTKGLEDLFLDGVKDIYYAEKKITKALPKMIKKAGADELRTAFEEHLQQTEQQIERLEQVFEQLEMPARGKKCVGMQNLIKEGQEMMSEAEDDDTRDALMIAAAQKIEHYEIAAYGTLRVWANLLGHSDSASLLEETLDEEKETDDRLNPVVVPTRRGIDQFQLMRETLARLELTSGMSFDRLVLEMLPRLPRDATVICLLPRVPVETSLALGHLRRQGFAVSVLLIGLADDGSDARVVAAGRLLAEGIRDVRFIQTEEELINLGEKTQAGPSTYDFAVTLA